MDRWSSSLRTRSMQGLFLHRRFLKHLLLARKRYAMHIMMISLSLFEYSNFYFPLGLPCSVHASFFQVNGAPPSECGGGEEDAGASYVELGQGGQEVIMMVMVVIIVMVMMIFMYWSD